MIRSSHARRRPRRLLIGALAALVPLTAGCAAGTAHSALDWHKAANGGYATAGQVEVINAFVLGSAQGGKLPAGSSASVFLSLYNGAASSDKLVSVAAPGTAAAVTVSGGQIAIPPQSTADLSGPRPKIILRRLTTPLTGTSVVRLVLSFSNAGSVDVAAPVEARTDYYATYSPAAPLSASAARSGAHGRSSGKPSPRAAKPSPSAGKPAKPRPSPTR